MSPDDSIDPYILFAAGAQAMRRRVEAAGLAIGGALGVAAEPYPHQVATVSRVLSDTRIRHLISDEVGMGKTVQALMILNALRWQNSRHRAVIIVPDRLVGQWSSECWTRGHCRASVEGDEATEWDQPWLRIVRPQSIRSGGFRLQPDQFDLLIIDEPQLIPVEVMESVERAAAEFRQLLVLSATPGLGDLARRRRMMAMLEPERAALADEMGQDLLEFLDRLEVDALAELLSSARISSTALFAAFSSGRRIARATRSDWGRYLPKRSYQRLAVEPLRGERERVRLGMEWLEDLRQRGGRMDRWRAAQALHRSTTSARGLLGGQADRSTKLAQAVDASAETPGDSRFDALTDLLASIWNRDPSEQVVVVAGDNPTIDFLEPRLERMFEIDGQPLEVTQLRRSSEASDNEVMDVQIWDRQLAPFFRGHSKLLLLGEWVQAGLNLHYFARNIVFYTAPWDCDAVDQLIGRLDRLRPNGLWRGDRGKHFERIRVWSIVHKDTPEARVISGLEALGVFERPLPPIPVEDASSIRSDLQALVFEQSPDAIRRLARMAVAWEDTGHHSRLADLSPFSAAAAQALYDRLQGAELPGPVLYTRREHDTLTTARERALSGWIELIRRAEIFDVRQRNDQANQDVRFSTLWYANKSATLKPFEITGVPGGSWMNGHVPFLTARRHLAQPPLKTVLTDEGQEGGRPLRFLDHGEEVHESLVENFLSIAIRSCSSDQVAAVTVAFDPRHPILVTCSGQVLAIAAGYFDPGEACMAPFDRASLEALVAQARTDAQREALQADVEDAQEWWRADQRWLRNTISAKSYFAGVRLDGSKWRELPVEVVRHAFMPLIEEKDSRCARVRGVSLSLSVRRAQIGCDLAVEGMNSQFKIDQASNLVDLREALVERLEVIEIEGSDFIKAREFSLERIKTDRSTVQEWAREGQIAAAERSLSMAEAMVALRRRWLAEIPDRLENAGPRITGKLVIRPAPFQDHG